MWCDSHAHLNDPKFRSDCPAVVARALEGGVGKIIVVGYDLPTSQKAVQLAGEYPALGAAVGVHPHDAKTWNQAAAQRLTALLQQPKVVALGEIGLDYHYNHSTREQQLAAFRAQLELALQYHKPVIIHNREAHQDTLQVITEIAPRLCGGVMHCFSGSQELAHQFLKLGFHLSFAGPLTYPNAQRLREVAASIPLERLLVETDCPYLAPEPNRGRRNEPLQVTLVGAKLAEVKGLPLAEVMAATTANCQRLFGI